MSRTSSSPEDRLDVTELIAILAAERDGAPWPPTSHRLRTEEAPASPTSHRPCGERAGGRRVVAQRLAPVLVGVLVLAVVALIGSLRPAPAPQATDAALAAAPAADAADASSQGPARPAPPSTAAPQAVVVPGPVRASRTAPPTTRPSAAASRARAADAVASSAASSATGSGAGPAGPGVRPVHPACRGDAGAPRPGDVICSTGRLSSPLKISVGGTAAAPIVYSGNGSTRVPGIMSTADNVVIQGFVSEGADSTGIWASGKNVVVQDNTVTQVRHTDEDLDAIRFFGDGFKVLHNSVHDLEGSSDIGGSHVDCIQTYATSRPGSSDVVIQGNRCEGIRAQCLMAEGPNADTASGKGGGGEGVSRNWLFDGNYCDAHAPAQSVALQDVQNVTLSNNVMAGKATKAFALGQGSTGTVVRGNTIGAGYGREVGFDDDSAREGYQGPPAR